MKFKLNGTSVEVKNGKLKCPAELRPMLKSLFGLSLGGPEDGDAFLIQLKHIFGKDAITDIEDDYDPFMVY